MRGKGEGSGGWMGEGVEDGCGWVGGRVEDG